MLFRLRYGKSSEFVLGDVMEEYTQGEQSKWWVWRQLWSVYAPSAPATPRIQGGKRMYWPLSHEIRFAARTLRRNPGFALIAILTIALGVGVNAGIFNLLNAIALRPLPVPEGGKMVAIYQIFHGRVSRSVHGAPSLFSTAEYETYRDSNHVFSGMVAYAPYLQATLGGETPREVMGAYVSCNYFDVLHEPPATGRTLVPSDCAAENAGAVVVLSDELWRGRFSGDSGIVGKTVTLNRQAFTVVGIARPDFHGTEAALESFWIPFTMEPALESNQSRGWTAFPRRSVIYENPNMSWLAVIGKLKDGESMGRARADLAAIAARIDRQYPGRTTTLAVNQANYASMPEARSIVMGAGAVILTAVAMVLMIVCANLANLLLARAAGRQKEITIRLSVGATRGQLVRQLMTESLMVALAGGILGCAAAFAASSGLLRVIMQHAPKDVPKFGLDVGPDVTVLAYSLAMTIFTGLAFGLVPALRATKMDTKTASERKNGLLRGGLVGAQVSVSMVLLIAAGLLLHALYAAQTVDPGFQTKDTLAVSFRLGNQGYDAARASSFQRQLVDRVAALPGIEAVAQARVTPLSDSHIGYAMTPSGGTQVEAVEINVVSPAYFPMLELPIVRGRNFQAGETQAAIVTQSTARRLWPGGDAIGQTLHEDDGRIFAVVGIAGDAQISHLGRSNETYVYLAPGASDQGDLQLLVHSKVNQRAAIRRVFRELDPNLAYEIAPLESNLEWWRAPLRIVGVLSGSLGGVALLLASLGIYGVAAFAVSRRVREIGIRMALGAEARSVQRLILRQSMRPVLIGAVIGIAGCAAVSKILSRILFGVSAYDPLAFAGVPILLIGIACLASHLPARRAALVDPAVALRHE